MAKTKEKELKEALEKEKEAVESVYEDVITKLNEEKDRLAHELSHEYRNARRYVRENPEIGVGTAFTAGILVGIVLTNLIRR